MSPASDGLAPYRALLEKVDAFWRRAVTVQPEAFACRAGCAGCCSAGLTVHPVEAMVIRAHLAAVPASARPPAAGAAAGADACVFLHRDRCQIYPVRPVICRTHGLPVRVDGRVDACPLNFRTAEWLPQSVLDLEHLNLLLALANREACRAAGLPDDAPRVALRDLAAGARAGDR